MVLCEMDLELEDDRPRYLPEICCGVSKSFLNLLLDHLPADGSLVLSIGCGSGMLEALLHRNARNAGRPLELYGVEVPSCHVQYLSPEKVLRVSGTREMHSAAMLATTLLFVYPRKPELFASYMNNYIHGALEQVIWIGPSSDWQDNEHALTRAFTDVKVWQGSEAGLPSYELMAVASLPEATVVNSPS